MPPSLRTARIYPASPESLPADPLSGIKPSMQYGAPRGKQKHSVQASESTLRVCTTASAPACCLNCSPRGSQPSQSRRVLSHFFPPWRKRRDQMICTNKGKVTAGMFRIVLFRFQRATRTSVGTKANRTSVGNKEPARQSGTRRAE